MFRDAAGRSCADLVAEWVCEYWSDWFIAVVNFFAVSGF